MRRVICFTCGGGIDGFIYGGMGGRGGYDISIVFHQYFTPLIFLYNLYDWFTIQSM